MNDITADFKNIFELALTTAAQTSKRRRTYTCKIIDNCPSNKLIVDYYYRYSFTNTIRRLRRNLEVGEFIETEYGIIYHHKYFNLYGYNSLSTIKQFLKDAQYKFTQVGAFLIFENEDSPVPINEPILLNDNSAVIVKLNFTQIGSLYVPSKRATRFFAFKSNTVYAQNGHLGTSLHSSIVEELKEDGKLKFSMEMLPILFSAQYNHRTLSAIEEYYSEKMVKTLIN